MTAALAASLPCGIVPACAQGAATEISLPLKFAGAYEGDIAVAIGPGEAIALDAERLIALLGERLSPAAIDGLRAAKTADGKVPVEALAALGIEASYDPATLELAVAIPVAAQGARALLAQEARADQPKPTLLPSAIAATAILHGRQRYVWGSGARASDLGPFELAADLAANVGGLDGVSLFTQVGFTGGSAGGLERGNVLAVHDDLRHAIRYSAGDIAPTVVGFQTSPLIGGISVERQYGALQPFRNVRPSGQFGFILENASTVELVVNGAVLRTLRLEPGQYNLRDFPFVNGLNQVEFYVVDGAGRRLLTSFSQYFSARLLDQGVFEFGATAGVLQDIGGMDKARYGGPPAISAYARYGVTDWLLMGANLQGSSRQVMGGIEGAVATPFGALAGLASVSQYRDLGRGWAALLGYEGSARKVGPISRPQLNLEVQATSRDFAPLSLRPLVNRYRLTAQGRFAGQLPGGVGVGVSVARFWGRDDEPLQTRFAASLGRRIGPVAVTGSYERIATKGPLAQQRFLLTLGFALGKRSSVRTSYDTGADLAAVEFSRFKADEIGSLGLRGSLSRSSSGITTAGEIDYNANRFDAMVEHAVIAERDLGRVISQESSLTGSTQIGFAGGRLAFGRPVGPRFAVVRPHQTLEGSIVSVRQGPGREHAQARTGALGAALAPAGNPYSASELRFDVDNLPPGYDLGEGQFIVVPAAMSGYEITVGSDASRVLLGTAVTVSGAPLALEGGSLTPLSGDQSQQILLFTNRAGRFVGNGLRPGSYDLRLGRNGRYEARVTIADDAKGVVDLGSILLQDKEKP